MQVVELQSLLVERQLAKSGKKEVLVNRLLTHAEQHSEDTLLPLSQPAITDTGTLTGAQLQGATIIVDTPPAPARRKTRTRRSATATATADTADAPISQPLPTSAAATTADALAGSQDLQAASVAIQSVQTSTVGTEVGEERVVGDEGAQEDGGELEYATLPPDATPLPVYRRRRSWALADKPDMDNSEVCVSVRVCVVQLRANTAARRLLMRERACVCAPLNRKQRARKRERESVRVYACVCMCVCVCVMHVTVITAARRL